MEIRNLLIFSEGKFKASLLVFVLLPVLSLSLNGFASVVCETFSGFVFVRVNKLRPLKCVSSGKWGGEVGFALVLLF